MEASFIVDIFAFIDTSKYVLLFFACFFEGTLAMMAGGVLWSIGFVAVIFAMRYAQKRIAASEW